MDSEYIVRFILRCESFFGRFVNGVVFFNFKFQSLLVYRGAVALHINLVSYNLLVIAY